MNIAYGITAVLLALFYFYAGALKMIAAGIGSDR